VLSTTALLACTGSDDGGADGSRPNDGGVDGEEACTVTPPAACPDPPVDYGDVEPIIAERCLACHIGARGGPWGLTTYGHVADWAEVIRAAMLTCAMPPPDAGIDMPDSERELILTWIKCGFPE
jgi:hypothetical protein